MTETDHASATTSEEDILDRPIVVGYAFGPKKMSTMGVVMAEASKTRITASIYNHYTGQGSHSLRRDSLPKASDSNYMETSQQKMTAVELEEQQDEEHYRLKHLAPEEDSDLHHIPTSEDAASSLNNASGHQNDFGFHSSQSRVVFSIDGYTGGGQDGGLANIVRHFQSSCSDSESTGTCTASTNTNTDSRTASSSMPPPTLTTDISAGSSSSRQRSLIRVSFVPLDPDFPLQDQHGGKIDIILHKLTEDILCMSQLSSAQSLDASDARETTILSPMEHDAIRRVQRLSEFHKHHPQCCLVDDPDRVQVVMSRSDIASKLQDCLQNVTTKSGRQVSSPKYSVVARKEGSLDSIGQHHHIAQQLKGLSYPIIVKPLIAAGTKASHAMAVLMDETGLDKLALKAPCLCQEFSNHDTVLYKVYVLGDFVSVHKRRSLPNLPRECPSRFAYVEFDSHRPYPRLSDFGFDKESDLCNANGKKRPRATLPLSVAADAPSLSFAAAACSTPASVTVEEVMPVVDALKVAFGLELFGFDVLIESEHQTMLVVDVNYFPSYKEVQNFPSLLAKYLADRVIASRKLAAASHG